MFDLLRRSKLTRLFFWEGLSLGLFVASVLFALLELFRNIGSIEGLKDSPALVVVPAFLAAYMSLRAIAEQGKLSQDLAIDSLDRNERAARADLPISISRLKRLCDRNLARHFDQSVSKPAWSEFEDVLYRFQGTIRYSSRSNAEYLLKIIRHYQVLFARDEGMTTESIEAALNEPNKIKHYDFWSSAKNWAVLATMVENVFGYARGSTDNIPTEPVNERVRSQFFMLVHSWEDYPILNDILTKSSAENSFEMDFSK